MQRQRRYTILVNPQSGKGRGLASLEAVRPVFAAVSAELDVRVPRSAQEAASVAAAIHPDDCDGLGIIGGDGTVHEIVNSRLSCLSGRTVDPLPLGIIPGGTGNSVAHDLGGLDALTAASRIVAGHTTPLDVARVNTGGRKIYCISCLGWGGVVDINRTAERWRMLGAQRYTWAAMFQVLFSKRRSARLTLDGEVIEDRFVFIELCNTQHTGKGMRLAPHADMRDGELDVVMVRQATRLQMFRVLRTVFDGSHLALPCVECRRGRAARLDSEVTSGLNIDGELKGSTPATVDVVRGALKVFS